MRRRGHGDLGDLRGGRHRRVHGRHGWRIRGRRRGHGLFRMYTVQIFWLGGAMINPVGQTLLGPLLQLPDGVKVRSVVLQEGHVLPLRGQVLEVRGVDVERHFISCHVVGA